MARGVFRRFYQQLYQRRRWTLGGVAAAPGSVTFEGTSAGVSGSTAAIAAARGLNSASAAVSGSTAAANVTRVLSSISAAVSGSTSVANVARSLDSASAGVSGSTSAATVARGLSGGAAALSGQTSNINATRPIIAAAAAVSGNVTDLTIGRFAQGTVAATSSASATELGITKPRKGRPAAMLRVIDPNLSDVHPNARHWWADLSFAVPHAMGHEHNVTTGKMGPNVLPAAVGPAVLHRDSPDPARFSPEETFSPTRFGSGVHIKQGVIGVDQFGYHPLPETYLDANPGFPTTATDGDYTCFVALETLSFIGAAPGYISSMFSTAGLEGGTWSLATVFGVLTLTITRTSDRFSLIFNSAGDRLVPPANGSYGSVGWRRRFDPDGGGVNDGLWDVFINGERGATISQDDTIISPPIFAPATLSIGRRASSLVAPTNNADGVEGRYIASYFWRRGLSDAEMFHLHDDPLAPFRPKRHRAKIELVPSPGAPPETIPAHLPNQTSIANGALVCLGERRISSILDGSKTAKLLFERFYEVLKELLRMHPWTFATKRATLPADVVTPVWGFSNAFTLPTECLRLLEVDNLEQRMPYQVEGRKILTNARAPLQIRYVSLVRNTLDMPSSFRQAFSALLAADVAEAITGSTEKLQQCLEAFRDRMEAARDQNAWEELPGTVAASEWISVRGRDA